MASREATMDRRQFLRGAGAVGLGTAVAGTLATPAFGSTTTLVRVFRLSTRREDACNACKAHAANRYYRLHRYANHGRAHRGCNCDIVSQKIRKRLWTAYFVRSDGSLRRVHDVRQST